MDKLNFCINYDPMKIKHLNIKTCTRMFIAASYKQWKNSAQ